MYRRRPDEQAPPDFDLHRLIFFERHRQRGAHRCAVAQEHREFLARAIQNTFEVQSAPSEEQDRRRFQRLVLFQEPGDLAREAADVAAFFVGVEEQFHLQRFEIAADVLQRRRLQAGDADLCKGVSLIQRVFFRVEHHRNLLVGRGVDDDGFF